MLSYFVHLCATSQRRRRRLPSPWQSLLCLFPLWPSFLFPSLAASFFLFFFSWSFFFFFFRAAPVTYGGSQARVHLELQLLAYARATATPGPSRVCSLCHSSWQHWILNPLSEARDHTESSWMLVGFGNH